MKKEEKIMSLYFGSPPPCTMDYQMGCIDILFGKYSKLPEKELNKEHKRRIKLYKKDCKEYWKNRGKELTELEKLLKKKKTG